MLLEWTKMVLIGLRETSFAVTHIGTTKMGSFTIRACSQATSKASPRSLTLREIQSKALSIPRMLFLDPTLKQKNQFVCWGVNGSCSERLLLAKHSSLKWKKTNEANINPFVTVVCHCAVGWIPCAHFEVHFHDEMSPSVDGKLYK